MTDFTESRHYFQVILSDFQSNLSAGRFFAALDIVNFFSSVSVVSFKPKGRCTLQPTGISFVFKVRDPVKIQLLSSSEKLKSGVSFYLTFDFLSVL